MRCDFEHWVWDPIIPLKHRIFLWLAFWGRLNTRDNMVRKKWSSTAPFADCDVCPATENVTHIILRCIPAQGIWEKFSLSALAARAVDLMSFLESAAHHLGSPCKWNIAFAACAVTLWHARNDRVFNNRRWTAAYTSFYAADMIRLWSNRVRRHEVEDALVLWVHKLDC
jgi:hypothetical protein